MCTLGPTTATAERIVELVAAGMDVARLNFSHGDPADHEQVYRHVRTAAEQAGRAVGILADLQGPKIRLGRFTDGPVHWQTGDVVRITVEGVPGTRQRVSTTYSGLASDAKPGDRLLVDDGRVGLQVLDIEGPDVVCEVTIGERVLRDAGLPEIAFRSIVVAEEDLPAVSQALIEDDRIAAVSLTGSERAGAAVAATAGRAIRKSLLELGGSDPFVVLDDADLDLVVAAAVKSRFINGGRAVWRPSGSSSTRPSPQSSAADSPRRGPT